MKRIEEKRLGKKHFSSLILCIILRGFVWYIFPLLCPPLLLVANVSQIPWKSLRSPIAKGGRREFSISESTRFFFLSLFLLASYFLPITMGQIWKGHNLSIFLPFIQFLMANGCVSAGLRMEFKVTSTWGRKNRVELGLLIICLLMNTGSFEKTYLKTVFWIAIMKNMIFLNITTCRV